MKIPSDSIISSNLTSVTKLGQPVISLGKMLIINVDELNFAENREDLSKVIDRIDAQLHGLF